MGEGDPVEGEFLLIVPNRQNHHHQIFLCLPAGLDKRGVERFIAVLQPGSMTDGSRPEPLSGQWAGMDAELVQGGIRVAVGAPVRPRAAVDQARQMAKRSKRQI